MPQMDPGTELRPINHECGGKVVSVQPDLHGQVLPRKSRLLTKSQAQKQRYQPHWTSLATRGRQQMKRISLTDSPTPGTLICWTPPAGARGPLPSLDFGTTPFEETRISNAFETHASECPHISYVALRGRSVGFLESRRSPSQQALLRGVRREMRPISTINQPRTQIWTLQNSQQDCRLPVDQYIPMSDQNSHNWPKFRSHCQPHRSRLASMFQQRICVSATANEIPHQTTKPGPDRGE